MSKFVLPTTYSRIIEHKNSRKRRVDSIDSTESRSYTVWALNAGEADPVAAYAAINVLAPATVIVDFITLTKRSIVNLDEVDAILGKFSATVQWSHTSSDRFSDQRSDDIVDPANDEQVEFNFGPISQFFSQGYETIKTDGAPLIVSDKINVNSQGKSEGFQFDPPSDGFSITLVVPSATVTPAYLRLLACSRNMINDDTFRGWAAGEVCFISCSGRRNSDGDWQITFNYAVAKNETITTIDGTADKAGSPLTFSSPQTKRGFDLLWILEGTVKVDDSGNKNIVPFDKGGYISRFLTEFDMTTLGPSA